MQEKLCDLTRATALPAAGTPQGTPLPCRGGAGVGSVIIITLLLLSALSVSAGEIVVGEGESIHEALRQAREWRRTGDPRCQDGITIRLQAGRYYMSEPLFLRPEDSGTAASPTIIAGQGDAVICGDAPRQHRQLWPAEGMLRITGFDPATRTITIPTPPRQTLQQLQALIAPGQPDAASRPLLEMVVHQRWAIAILRVREIRLEGRQCIVSFMDPESRLEFDHPWPQPVIGGERGNSSFLLRTTEQRHGVEQLVVVDGASHIHFERLCFENTCWNRPLLRGHVTLQGGFPLVDAYKLTQQEGLPWDDTLENQAWVERPVSAVSVGNAEHVTFRDCHFRRLAATALDFQPPTRACTVEASTFDHIGGTAILAGSFAESPREVHRPYADLAAQCRELSIVGNTISDAACEDWGAVGIGCGYVKDCTIRGNTVSGVNYSGICVGWGWTAQYTGMERNRIVGNSVSDYARQLYDAGGIYTLSNQPGSLISANYIAQPHPAPYATNHRAFCIYLDARTDGFTIEHNRTADAPADAPTDAPRVVGGSPANTRLIRRDEIGDNHPGPHLIIKQ